MVSEGHLQSELRPSRRRQPVVQMNSISAAIRVCRAGEALPIMEGNGNKLGHLVARTGVNHWWSKPPFNFFDPKPGKTRQAGQTFDRFADIGSSIFRLCTTAGSSTRQLGVVESPSRHHRLQRRYLHSRKRRNAPLVVHVCAKCAQKLRAKRVPTGFSPWRYLRHVISKISGEGTVFQLWQWCGE